MMVIVRCVRLKGWYLINDNRLTRNQPTKTFATEFPSEEH